uniref:Uncharacterized protein n=1 Tax=Anguilla anguilla TaxID=7936 RepID=A0A0E9R687_ANGAN
MIIMEDALKCPVKNLVRK